MGKKSKKTRSIGDNNASSREEPGHPSGRQNPWQRKQQSCSWSEAVSVGCDDGNSGPSPGSRARAGSLTNSVSGDSEPPRNAPQPQQDSASSRPGISAPQQNTSSSSPATKSPDKEKMLRYLKRTENSEFIPRNPIVHATVQSTAAARERSRSSSNADFILESRNITGLSSAQPTKQEGVGTVTSGFQQLGFGKPFVYQYPRLMSTSSGGFWTTPTTRVPSGAKFIYPDRLHQLRDNPDLTSLSDTPNRATIESLLRSPNPSISGSEQQPFITPETREPSEHRSSLPPAFPHQPFTTRQDIRWSNWQLFQSERPQEVSYSSRLLGSQDVQPPRGGGLEDDPARRAEQLATSEPLLTVQSSLVTGDQRATLLVPQPPASGLLAHTCPFCKVNFPTPDDLATHKKGQHTDHYCERCGVFFRTTDQRSRHWTNEHVDVMGCSICQRPLAEIDDPWDHLWAEHAEIAKHFDMVPCVICDVLYFWIRDLELHQREKHPLQCVYCKKMFTETDGQDAFVIHRREMHAELLARDTGLSAIKGVNPEPDEVPKIVTGTRGQLAPAPLGPTPAQAAQANGKKVKVERRKERAAEEGAGGPAPKGKKVYT